MPDPKDAPSDDKLVKRGFATARKVVRDQARLVIDPMASLDARDIREAEEAYRRIVAHAEAQQGTIEALNEQLTYAHKLGIDEEEREAGEAALARIVAHAEALEAALRETHGTAALMADYDSWIAGECGMVLDEESGNYYVPAARAALTGPGEPE